MFEVNIFLFDNKLNGRSKACKWKELHHDNRAIEIRTETKDGVSGATRYVFGCGKKEAFLGTASLERGGAA
jgi:hypothetical protein